MIRSASFAALVALLLSVPSQASAYWPFYGLGYGYANGYPYAGANYLDYFYGTTQVVAPPYFSIYPPVYYSHQITARHYGASPYAWLPGMSPITYLPPSGPMIMKNPHARDMKPADPNAVAASEAAPAVIENPFVKDSQPAGMANPYVAQLAR